MPWTILKTEADWNAYKTEAATKLGVFTERITWGNGPQTYPALVTSHMPPYLSGTDPKVYSCYVYPDDCKQLLSIVPTATPVKDPDAPVLPNQQQFNRWSAAFNLVCARVFVETGLCKTEQFESWLLEAVEKVDKFHGEKKAELRDQLTKYEATVLDTLEPPV